MSRVGSSRVKFHASYREVTAWRIWIAWDTGEEWKYEDFLKGIGGTRHMSAARLCKAHDDLLVFIMSQDGELKVFSSDGDKVNAFGPLDVTRAPVGMA